MRYTPETKAAVMSALLTGQSVSSVAREYDIPKGTVSGWKKEVIKPTNPTQKNEEIGELLVGYLRENLKALTAQAEQFQDKDWLREQSAESVAVLHGVMTDKAVRLLEAMGAQNASNNKDS